MFYKLILELHYDLNRIANQRIMELEAQIEDIQENQQTVSNEELVEMKKKLNEQIKCTQERDSDLKKTKDKTDDMEKLLSGQSERIQQLEEQICKKDEEIKHMETRYIKYLNKARAVSILQLLLSFRRFYVSYNTPCKQSLGGFLGITPVCLSVHQPCPGHNFFSFFFFNIFICTVTVFIVNIF